MHASPLAALALLLQLLSGTSLVTAFGDGAPDHRCSNLVPMHNTIPQTSMPPYELLVRPDRYSPGDVVQVTLRAVDGSTFLGFALSAHRLDGDTEELVGGFQVPDNARGSSWYSANSGAPNCITHNGSPYTEITFNWTAPAKSVGDVAFTTPVVRSFATFWANITSKVVSATVPSQDSAFPPLTVGRSPNPISGSCGSDYGCIRSPALCNLANCEVYVKYNYLANEARVKMELHATGHFITLGLSDDSKMMDDLTLTCTSDSVYSMQLGYNPNYRYLNERHRWTPLQDKYIEQLDGGGITCEFSLPLSINITTFPTPRPGSSSPIDRNFDLRNPHYVFIAYGSTYASTSSVRKHTELPAISDGKVNLLLRSSHSAHRISGLKRAHGSVMLLAWQFLLPLGANLALFYRSLFMKSYGGIQLWFHLHRGFVLSAFGLTIIGLLLIFAQFGWSWSFAYATTQTHGAMGLTLLSLAAVQIVMGMLRPDKDAPRRPIFNIAHRTVAFTALGLADGVIITIGFLVTLPESYRKAHLVLSFSWLVFHVIFRVGVSIQLIRWSNRALLVVQKAEEQAKLENTRFRTLRLLFIVFLAVMMIFFFAWFITLMLF